LPPPGAPIVPNAFRTREERPQDALIRKSRRLKFWTEARASREARVLLEDGNVPWRPEDWREWPDEHWVATCCEGAHTRAVRDILCGLPDRERMSVAELTRGESSRLPFLAARFGRVVTVDLEETGAERAVLPPDPDLVVAVDTIEAKGADDLFARIRAALVEGGLLLATLVARPHASRPFPLRSGKSPSGFHEVELQYRLRRAGFQGLRLRRFRGECGEEDVILGMAVRRALN
jgi:hypothetical protein